jgi:hypothetical protein
MTREQRGKEICEIIALVDQVARLSNHQLVEVLGIRVVVARLGDSSEQVETIENRGQGLARSGELVG